MNTIGLVITQCLGGISTFYTANGGEWTRRVADIRQDLLNIFKFNDDKNFATLLTFSPAGTYIIIAHPIDGRDGDYLAGWIFIPENIDVNGERVNQLVNIVKQQLCVSKIDVNLLDKTFSTTYPTLESSPLQPSTKENVYALRQPGFYPIEDILGDGRYQKYYTKYKYVIIADKDTPAIITNVTDLTRQNLETSLVLSPPFAQDLQGGITVHLNDINRTPFNRPMRCQKGQTLSLVFKRQGFNLIPHQETIIEKNQICSLPRNMQWKKTITKSMFNIADRNSNKDLNSAVNIYVNDIPVNANGITIAENEAINAKLTITANGYGKYEKTGCNLLNKDCYNITLNRSDSSKTFDIKLSNGSNAKITITGKKLPHASESPLIGYKVQDGHLTPDGNTNKIVYMLLGFGAAALLALIIWLVTLAINVWLGDDNTVSQDNNSSVELIDNNVSKPQDDVADNKVDDLYTLENAIKYLDEKDKWTKDELDKYPDLEGLFEDLNGFNFSALEARKENLSKSNNFKLILDAVVVNKNRTTFPDHFNSNPNDFTITVAKYIDVLKNFTPKENNDQVNQAEKKTKPAAAKPADKTKNNQTKPAQTTKTKKVNGDI